VFIDDPPNAVVLSGFDPVRREIDREETMTRISLDGRIHPTRSEGGRAKVSQGRRVHVRLGEEAVPGKQGAPLHSEIVKLLGDCISARVFPKMS